SAGAAGPAGRAEGAGEADRAGGSSRRDPAGEQRPWRAAIARADLRRPGVGGGRRDRASVSGEERPAEGGRGGEHGDRQRGGDAAVGDDLHGVASVASGGDAL